MNTEHEFNKLLGTQLKALEPATYKLKVAEKYHEGISDFFIWCKNTSAVVEVKFVKEPPARQTTRLMTHPFDPVQLTFLENVALTGNKAYGLVALDYEKMAYLFWHSEIPRDGNWTLGEFEMSKKKALATPYSKTGPLIVEFIFR